MSAIEFECGTLGKAMATPDARRRQRRNLEGFGWIQRRCRQQKNQTDDDGDDQTEDTDDDDNDEAFVYK